MSSEQILLLFQLVDKEKKDDYDYNVQYHNKFHDVGYQMDDLTYHIWESEVITELCSPVEKKELLESTGKMLEFRSLKN